MDKPQLIQPCFYITHPPVYAIRRKTIFIITELAAILHHQTNMKIV
jgi:hypothetical protein